jgi:hypothetical protein
VVLPGHPAKSSTMPLPDTIALRYTEEDAGYLSVRPVVKQTFRLHELLDMVVSVAGKDAARVQQIFRGGTVVYHGYRYWWDALSAELPELEKLLAGFPDDNPARPFVPQEASAVLFEMGGGTQRVITEISQGDASRKKLFTRQTPWGVLLAFAASHAPRYGRYDHARKADLFRLSLPFEGAQRFLAAFLAPAPRKVRYRWSTLRPPAALTFVCPRKMVS